VGRPAVIVHLPGAGKGQRACRGAVANRPLAAIARPTRLRYEAPAMTRALLIGLALALLAGCGDDDDGSGGTPGPTRTATPWRAARRARRVFRACWLDPAAHRSRCSALTLRHRRREAHRALC